MKDKRKMIYYSSVLLCVVIILNNLIFRGLNQEVEDISYDVFLDQVYSMNIKEVEVSTAEGYIYYTLKNDLPGVESNGKEDVVYSTVLMDDSELVDRLYDSGAKFGQVAPVIVPWYVQVLVTYVLPIAVIVLMWRFVFKRMGGLGGGNVMSFGKSNAKIYAKDQTGKTFADVAGTPWTC